MRRILSLLKIVFYGNLIPHEAGFFVEKFDLGFFLGESAGIKKA